MYTLTRYIKLQKVRIILQTSNNIDFTEVFYLISFHPYNPSILVTIRCDHYSYSGVPLWIRIDQRQFWHSVSMRMNFDYEVSVFKK